MNELQEYFGRELPGINAFLEEQADGLQSLVREVARHVLLSGGKRIRPVLTILYARMLGRNENLLPMACALEMLHSATLVHDDILDEADLRRGKPSAHKVFGTTEAVLAGDVMLALANQLGASYSIPRLNWLLAQGIMATATGEVMELAQVGDPDPNREKYLDIIIGKTARLIETACRCGAAMATDDREAEEAAGAYGLNLGIAFQLVDDALDYVSPEDTMGKPEGGDLREGKLTLPLILYLESLERKRSRVLAEKIAARTLTDQEQEDILADIRAGGYAEQTRQEAERYVGLALDALTALPDCTERTVLGQAAAYVLARKK